MATVHIGNLGTVRDPVDMDFEYFGATIRVHPDLTDAALTDFMREAEGLMVPPELPADPTLYDPDAARAMYAYKAASERLVTGLIQQCVHPDDWEAFSTLAFTNRQSTLDRISLAKQIIEAVSGFPTTRPADSSGGPSTTAPPSTGGSSVPAAFTTRERQEKAFLEHYRGKPWLQVAGLRARDGRLALQAEAAQQG